MKNKEPHITKFELIEARQLAPIFVTRKTFDYFNHILKQELISEIKKMKNNTVINGDYILIYDEEAKLQNIIYNNELYLQDTELDDLIYSRLAIENLVTIKLNHENKTFSCSWDN